MTNFGYSKNKVTEYAKKGALNPIAEWIDEDFPASTLQTKTVAEALEIFAEIPEGLSLWKNAMCVKHTHTNGKQFLTVQRHFSYFDSWSITETTFTGCTLSGGNISFWASPDGVLAPNTNGSFSTLGNVGVIATVVHSAYKPLQVIGLTGSTKNLTEWDDGSGTVVSKVDKDGKFFYGSSRLVDLTELQAEVAASTDFADFQSRIAALT